MTALLATLLRVLRRRGAPPDRPHSFAHPVPGVFRSEAFPEDLGDAYRSA